jgi:hypothetical protein
VRLAYSRLFRRSPSDTNSPDSSLYSGITKSTLRGEELSIRGCNGGRGREADPARYSGGQVDGETPTGKNRGAEWGVSVGGAVSCARVGTATHCALREGSKDDGLGVGREDSKFMTGE